MDPPSDALVLPPIAQAPGLARDYARTLSSDWSADVLDVVLLVVSEAVTNAVRYGHGQISLTISATRDRIRIEVSDANPVPPHRRPADNGLAEHGRGLHLLDALTTAWGARPHGDGRGKTIWLDVAP